MKPQIRKTIRTEAIMSQIDTFTSVARLQAIHAAKWKNDPIFTTAADQSFWAAASLAVTAGLAEWLPINSL